MKTIRLPNTDLDVSSLCFGTAEFGTAITPGDAERLTAAFIEAGGNFFDSAHVYAFWVPGGLGVSERTLGACLRSLGVRDRCVIATKGGHPDQGPDYRRPDDYLSEAVVAGDITESLERLGTDRIDLYYLHRDDLRVPVGEIVDMMNAEIARERIRYPGVSNWSVDRLSAANAYAREHGRVGFVASQVQWSLAVPNWKAGHDPTVRFVTDEDARWYASMGLPVVAYTATAGGYFSGRGQERGAFASLENAARADRAHKLATLLGCTPTQVALAYLLHQTATVIPLFSTGNAAHLAEAIASADVSLTPEQVRWLREGEIAHLG